jgi:cytochrome c
MRSLVAIFIAALAGNCLGQATQQVFERCVACHAKEGEGDLGPNLHGVVGRKAGSLEDFRYSRAMARSGIVWNEKTLDAFLKAPDQLVPGTRMPFEGIANDAERAAVIQYLKTLK